MLKIAVCDDSESSIADLKNAIELHSRKDECELYFFATGDEVLHWMSKHKIDVVIMDVELKDESGIDVASKLKEMRRDIVLVYYSFYDKYLRNMVTTEPFDFVQKPINQERFNQTIDRIFGRFDLFRESVFSVSFNGITHVINLEDVVYFCSKHRAIYVNMGDKELRFYDKLDNVEKRIEPIAKFFARANKSYYVNLFEITGFSKTRVEINGEIISITKNYAEKFYSKYFDFTNLYI